jgi:hypothetical protein
VGLYILYQLGADGDVKTAVEHRTLESAQAHAETVMWPDEQVEQDWVRHEAKLDVYVRETNLCRWVVIGGDLATIRSVV